MVVFDVCDQSEVNFRCKSPAEISKALKFSYMLVVENYEHYKPENHGINADEPIVVKNSKATWYAISDIVRIDFVKQIRINEVEYYKFRIGLRTD